MRLLHRRGKQPDPPQEVRLILPDGSKVGPLPLRYEGVTDGLHRWVALADRRLIPADGQPLSFRIKMMPAKTSVLVAFVPAKELEAYL